MNIEALKKANKIYQSLSGKSIDEAMQALKTFDNIEYEVLKLVESLINNSQHSSTYFDAQLGKSYQYALEKTWQAGDEVDGYRLDELIGQGGMSVVFKAQRINNKAQKPVAIKLFNLPHHNPDLKKQFLREQSILTELSHPNVIDFHHGESTEQGDSYIVMELLDQGLSIDEYVEKRHASKHHIVDLLIQAANGLHYAHKHLVVHLDVKPSNLIVNQSGQLKVLDFGIAKLINPDFDLTNDHQRENTLVALTPTFASPEQVKVQNIDTSSDVFSLAAVAVLLLTGKQPFPANRLLNNCADDESHVTKLLSTSLDDKDLKNILLKALREDRHLRYQDMFAFRQDLQAWQMKKPVSASGNTWWYQLNRFVVRRTALFVVSSLFMLTLLLGVIMLGKQNQAIKREAAIAKAVKSFMLGAFSVTDPDSAQGAEISAKALLLSASQKIEADNALDENIKHELYVAMASANGKLGLYPEAVELLQAALLIQAENESDIALLAQYLLSSGEMEKLNKILAQIEEDEFSDDGNKMILKRVRAIVAAQAGRYDEAFAIQKTVDDLAKSDVEYIENQALLAEIYYLSGESEKSIEVINAVKKTHPLPITTVLNLKLNSDLVQYHDRLGNFKAALSLTLENIKSYKAVLGDEHPGLGDGYNALSAFQWLDGQLDESLASSAISEAIFRKRFGDSSEGLAQSLSNAGLAYYYKKQNQAAIEKLTAATDMLSKIFGADHPETMNAKANLATILNAIGYPEKALPILQDMYQIESKTLGLSHRSTLYTQQALALTLANLGQFEVAIKHASENAELIQASFAGHVNMTSHTFSVLGRVYFKAGDHESALKNNLIHVNQWTDGDENNLAQSLNLVAQSYFELKEFEAAFDYFQQWIEKLISLNRPTDKVVLLAQLDVVALAQEAGRHELAKSLMQRVSSVVEVNDLFLPEVSAKITELSE